MCGLYSQADKALYLYRTRSLRLHGMVTTLRLENIFWDILARIAKDNGTTLNQTIIKLIDEAMEQHGSIRNTTSFLRVCCMIYLIENTPEN